RRGQHPLHFRSARSAAGSVYRAPFLRLLTRCPAPVQPAVQSSPGRASRPGSAVCSPLPPRVDEVRETVRPACRPCLRACPGPPT
ncbi:hypothetical protein Cadr_000017101, partial [Camelus dromedarius]